MRWVVRGGTVYDPIAGIDGEVRDICIEDGRIVASHPADLEPDRSIDASGRVVLAGAIDLHSHIAGPSVHRARRLQPSLSLTSESALASNSNDNGPLVPALPTTAQRYLALGYTLAVDAAIAPSGARQAHWELSALEGIDRGFLVLLANHELLIELLGRDELELAVEVAASIVARTGAFGIKAVNPGGVSRWKRDASAQPSVTEEVSGRGVRPADILQLLARVADERNLPHPLHIHCNHLGRAGNVDTTLETSRVLDGFRHHLAHVQFHAYGARDDGSLLSAGARIAEHIDASPDVTADVGQVMFGDALTISADVELQHFLWKMTGKPWVHVETELETGCGIVPLSYKRRSWLHTVQWATGLEIFLETERLERLSLTTDHPNGGSFLKYPKLIAQLMSRDVREEALDLASPDAVDRTRLRDLSREFTLYDVAQVTRAAPARALGLVDRGHLQPGAIADLVVYSNDSDRERMFRSPSHVFRRGELVVQDGEFVGSGRGATLRAGIDSDGAGQRHFDEWFRDKGSYDPAQFGLHQEELAAIESILGGGTR